jgi:hypothetical protein
MMPQLQDAYSYQIDDNEFKILPHIWNGCVLCIDGQYSHLFSTAGDAARDCLGGHVSTVIVANPPYTVSTKKRGFPTTLEGWFKYNIEPLESLL